MSFRNHRKSKLDLSFVHLLAVSLASHHSLRAAARLSLPEMVLMSENSRLLFFLKVDQLELNAIREDLPYVCQVGCRDLIPRMSHACSS